MWGWRWEVSPRAQQVWHEAGKAFSSSPAPDASQALLTTGLPKPQSLRTTDQAPGWSTPSAPGPGRHQCLGVFGCRVKYLELAFMDGKM